MIKVTVDDKEMEVYTPEEYNALKATYDTEHSEHAKLTETYNTLNSKYTELLEKHTAMFDHGAPTPTEKSADEQFAELFKNI